MGVSECSLRCGPDTLYFGASCTQFSFPMPSPPTSCRQTPLPSHHRGSPGHSPKLIIKGLSLSLGTLEI